MSAPTALPTTPPSPSRAVARPTSRTWSEHLRITYNALRHYRVPDAYRSRLLIAIILLGVAVTCRAIWGSPLPVLWLLPGVVFYKSGEWAGGFYTIEVGPGFGWMLVTLLVRFMLTRPAVARPVTPQDAEGQSGDALQLEGTNGAASAGWQWDAGDGDDLPFGVGMLH